MSNIRDVKDLGYIKGIDYNFVSIDQYIKYQSIDEKYIDKYPWMKSILVFVFGFSNQPIKKKHYLPARYAIGEDYHLVIKEKLEEVALRFGLNNYEIFVDNSFLDEKLLAYLAGLGGYGKNNLIITKNYGTNIAIGEIIIDKIYDYNSLFKDSPCRDCTICLRACPTKAINDAGFKKTNCISYLTQYISDEYHLYDKVLNLTIGCDICQVVCPFNKDKEYEYDSRFNFDRNSLLDLDILKKLDKSTYQEYYKNKSFNWIGYLKMLRNILTLDTNNNNIRIEEIDYFQNKYKNVKWFYLHLEYLKGKINGIT